MIFIMKLLRTFVSVINSNLFYKRFNRYKNSSYVTVGRAFLQPVSCSDDVRQCKLESQTFDRDHLTIGLIQPAKRVVAMGIIIKLATAAAFAVLPV